MSDSKHNDQANSEPKGGNDVNAGGRTITLPPVICSLARFGLRTSLEKDPCDGGKCNLSVSIRGVKSPQQAVLRAFIAQGERELKAYQDRLDAEKEKLKGDPLHRLKMIEFLEYEWEGMWSQYHDAKSLLGDAVVVLAARAHVLREVADRIAADRRAAEREEADADWRDSLEKASPLHDGGESTEAA